MTDEQINCAIAEACGISGNTYKLCLKTGNYEQSPNFCEDLNAMHEAEKHLKAHQLWAMARLIEVNTERYYFRATARERAEAFLRVVGKWEEGK